MPQSNIEGGAAMKSQSDGVSYSRFLSFMSKA